ncbi:MAG: vanadium-dependent haloperoxidase [Blastocatellia bacterium]
MKKPRHSQKQPAPSSRRSFLSQVSGATAATIVANVASSTATRAKAVDLKKQIVESTDDPNRLLKAYTCRVNAANMAMERPAVQHTSNGDDDRYPNKIASYSKGLPHNQLGEVDLNAYATLVKARTTQNPADFELIKLGLGRPLTSPQAGLAMDLEGPDSHHVTLPPAPRFDSAEAAGEAVELYWMALARDVHFSNYDNDPITAAAAADISRLSDFRGPRENAHTTLAARGSSPTLEAAPTLEALRGRRGVGAITARTLFRGLTPGDLNGYWLSQFLILDVPFGAVTFQQKMQTVQSGLNHMTKYQDWLDVENGADPSNNIRYDATPRHIRNLRDLAQWVHIDALYQAYLHACLIILGQGLSIDPGLPLYNAKAQAGFAQCGGPHILSFVTEVATRALKAVWYQKWFVHHRLRPEVYGGRVHNHAAKAATYPLHSDVLNSRAAAETFSRYGTYLLPQAFPEGSPTHSSYGSGHATVAGACVTVLKAFFDESEIIKNPMIPNADGTALVPYVGPPLTLGGELNKVATNVAFGRNAAGIHWRSDAINSLRLGEAVAIGILEEQKLTYNDEVKMTFTKFDGTKITI